MAKSLIATNSLWHRLKMRATRLWEHLEQRRHSLSWMAIALGMLGTTATLWPLATMVWTLLGFTSGQAWRLLSLGLCALLLGSGVWWINHGRTQPVRLLWLIVTAWAVSLGAVLAMTTLAWLALDTPQWQPPVVLTPRHLDSIATRAFAIVAGLGGVALLAIAYHRQILNKRGVEQGETKLFTERFGAAVSQMGEEAPAIRLGGAHALTHLADDAPTHALRQMCVNVLCGYLRMPHEPQPDKIPKNSNRDRRKEHRAAELEFGSQREVRLTIIRAITQRVRSQTPWKYCDYDFTGVTFEESEFEDLTFFGNVKFKQAHFERHAQFRGSIFHGDALFDGAEFDQPAMFARVKFNGLAEFSSTEFHHTAFFFFSSFARDCDFSSGKFHGSTSFGSVKFSEIAQFMEAEFMKEVDFKVSEFESSALFGGSFFCDKSSFQGAYFHDEADFVDAINDGTPASGKCPAGLVEASERSPGEVSLPEHWKSPHGVRQKDIDS